MLKHIRLAVRSDIPVSTAIPESYDPEEIVTRTVEVHVIPYIHEVVYSLYKAFYRDRYATPGFLILGWKTWVQLGYAMSGFTDPGRRISRWNDIPIVVNDTEDCLIKFLPVLDDVAMGGFSKYG